MSLLSKKEVILKVGKKANKWHRYTVNIILAWYTGINKINILYDNDGIVNDDDDVSIYIKDIYDNDIKSKYVIVISGENIKEDIECSMLISTNIMYSNVYIPYLYLSLTEHKKSINNCDYICPKTKFCAYMYTITYEHRRKAFKLINSIKPVDALGQCCNNVSRINDRYTYTDTETYSDIGIKIYSQYKFVIAMENSLGLGYATEKLINPIIANSIPIYWGDSNIFKYINKKRVIYMPDYTDETLCNRIAELYNDEAKYMAVINEPTYIISPEACYSEYVHDINSFLSRIL